MCHRSYPETVKDMMYSTQFTMNKQHIFYCLTFHVLLFYLNRNFVVKNKYTLLEQNDTDTGYIAIFCIGFGSFQGFN